MKLNILTSITTLITTALLAGLLSAGLSSCSDNNEPGGGSGSIALVDPAMYKIPYEKGVWSEVYNDNVALPLAPFVLSHTGAENGKSWLGACPSVVSDNIRHSDWSDYQWCSMTAGGVGGAGYPYIAMRWDVTEDTEGVPTEPSIKISRSDGASFSLTQAWITTTSESFYTMKYGTADSPAFNGNDWARVNIIGMRGTAQTGIVRVYIARDGQVLGDPDVIYNHLSNSGGWNAVDLSALGTTDYVYFQMESSRTTVGGRYNSVPTFVLGAFIYQQ